MKKYLLILPLLLAACGQQNTVSIPGMTAEVSADLAPTDVMAATSWARAKAISIMASQSPALRLQYLEMPEIAIDGYDSDAFAKVKIGTMATKNICNMVAERLNETSNGTASYSCTGRNLYMSY